MTHFSNRDGLESGVFLKREESNEFHQDLCNPLGMEAESKEMPQQLIRYRGGDETGGLDMVNSMNS